MLLPILKEKAICQGSPLLSGIKFAFIHSTAPSQSKWKNKWGFDVEGSTDPSKKYGKYLKRLQRAETKRTLKRLQNMNKPPKNAFKASISSWNAWRTQNQKTQTNENTWKNFNNQANSSGTTRPKSNASHSARTTESVKENRRKYKRNKSKRPHFPWDIDDPDERVIEVKLGGRWFYWSFSKWDELKWQTSRNWTGREKYSESNFSDDETTPIGSASDRMILGLAPGGPLKLEDVKQAFHQCALKWHPDRNPGPSKVIAEEKFKRCGAAYKALCDALSAI